MSKLTIEQIVEAVQDLPALPHIANQAVALLSDPEVHILEVGDLIAMDQGLSAKILKLANSAYYGVARQIFTVTEAIVLLGFNAVRDLVITSTAKKILSRGVEGYELDEGELWKHSMCTALCASLIEKEISGLQKGKGFTAALLHDVGKLILARHVKDELAKIRTMVEENNVPFMIAEKEILGFDHTELGARVIEKWNLPAELAYSIRFHHTPEESNGDLLTAVVHAADAMVLMMGIGIGMDGLLYPLSETVFTSIGIDEEKFQKIFSFMPEEINKAENFLELPPKEEPEDYSIEALREKYKIARRQ